MNTSDLEHKLQARKIQPTAMRLLVLDYLEQQAEAVSLSDLEEALTHSDRTTLYRTLKTFHQHGLVHQVHDEQGSAQYALCSEECSCSYPEDIHVHFFCSDCSSTYCLPQLPIPDFPLPESFRAESANFVISGSCPSCVA